MSPLRSRGGIFISYRREETAAYAGRLYDRLSDRFGDDRVFMDVDSISVGIDFTRAITEAVSGCNVLLALIGREWSSITDGKGKRRIDNPDDFVRVEIETALKRNIRIVPVLIDGAMLPQADDLPPSLHSLVRRQALELSHASFRFEMPRLVAAIDEVIETEPGRPVRNTEASDRNLGGEWRAQIGMSSVGVATFDTVALIKLTRETHNLVARNGFARSYLSLDDKQIASSWKHLAGMYSFSLSDGLQQRAAQVELQKPSVEAPSAYYKILRLVIDGQEVPLIKHPT
jgi:hypothetical protein